MSTTEQQIAVMQAFVDGKTLQYRHKTHNNDGLWGSVSRTPIWAWDCIEYKIKPKPRKVMMQMWESEHSEAIRATPVNKPPYGGSWLKVGEPFEFTYPDEDE
jgi:hypothetical protein